MSRPRRRSPAPTPAPSTSPLIPLDYATLKAREPAEGTVPLALGRRVHRALSWLQRAEQEADDNDARFIFLWIAFNAAYAQEIAMEKFSERGLQYQFLKKLIDLDTDRRLYELVWDEFQDPIRVLMNNRYVFQPFWDYQRGAISEAQWKGQFDANKRAVSRALGRLNTVELLALIFERLYVLRNQLVHGGATWGSRVNRDQVRDGAKIMHLLVPTVIHLMMENPRELWGDAVYPVVAP